MLKQITRRCFCLPNSPEADRPCLGYVQGDRYALMIDAGNSPAHHRLFLDEATATGLPVPSAIAITHSHWDHTYGMCAAHAPTLANSRTQQQLHRMSRWTWTLPAMEERLRTHEDILFCHECILKEYPDLSAIRVVPATVTYDASLTLDLGGVQALLIRLDNSHAEDCSVVFIPEEKVLFLGDITCDDLHHQPPCIHRARLEKLRRSLADMDFAFAVDGHWGQPMSKEEVLQGISECLASPEVPLLP